MNPGSVAGTIGDPSLALGAPGVFGGGSAPMRGDGNIFTYVPGYTTPANPAATGGDIVVAVYAIPAASFDAAGRGITVSAIGHMATNANAKRAKIIVAPTSAVVGSAVVGGTTVADTGASTASNVDWSLSANIFKRGGLNSNTQTVTNNGNIVGTTHGGITNGADITATEGVPMLVAITINNTTAAADCGLTQLDICAMN